MLVNVVMILVAAVVLVVVVGSSRRRQRMTERSRAEVLRTLAPVVAGTMNDRLELSGVFGAHPVEVSFHATGRLDTSGHSAVNNFEVTLIVLRGVRGGSPWGFYTSAVNVEPPSRKWRSVITYAGTIGRVLSAMTAAPVDPGIDARLEAGGMFDALERLAAASPTQAYVAVSYVPDGAAAVARSMQRAERAGAPVAERARHDAEAWLQREQGGHLRIEVERAGTGDPTPARLRAMLDAAVAIAQLNAVINPREPA